MIRVIGTACLAAGSVLLGFSAVRHLNERVKDLGLLMEGLSVIQRELDYRLAPLPELLKQAGNQTSGRVAALFELSAKGVEHLNGRTFRQVWTQAMEASQLRLEQSDLDILNQLGGVLGRYDGENQRQALELTRAKLEEQYKAAKEQSQKLGRVYGVLGLTAGAFLMILLV